MPATKSLADCRQFADEIVAAGGTVPDTLQQVLATADALMRPAATQDPLRGVFDRPVPDEDEVDALIADAARLDAIADCRGRLTPRVERIAVERWHKALHTGAADSVLTSLRKTFDQHAKAIEKARELIPRETPLDQWLSVAKPEAVTAWQQLPGHLAALTRIGNVAARFGARPLANFSLIKEVPGDATTSDVALFCACGGLTHDSAPFLQIDRGGRASPWMAVPLRLNSVSQAKERYRSWCESQWDANHYNTTVQYQNPADGSRSEFELKNPYRERADA